MCSFLVVVCWLMGVVWRVLFLLRCAIRVVPWLRFVSCCSLIVAGCLLCVVSCLMHVVSRVIDVCCLLIVV